ncbi:MAG: recombinase family protein, partial [Chloroflexota bacterium]
MENSGIRHPAEGGVSVGSGQHGDEVKVMTIIRVSHEDQLRGYGPEVQWTDDVLPYARFLGVIVDERHRRVIQESATGWDRPRFEAAVEEALQLHRASQIGGVFFPRVDRETRFLFGSISLLVTVLKQGMKVYFGRERFRLDPEDPESVEKYLRKVQEGNAYTQALKVNTSKARRKRAENDHRMPSGGGTWFHEYHPYRKASGLLPTIMSGKHTLRPERTLIGRRWATWILEEGRSLGECVRLTEKQYGVKVSRETLWRSLRDPSAIGKFYAYKTRIVASPAGQRVVRNPESEWLLVHEDASLAVLTREEFDAIREKFRDNKEKSFRNTQRWY